MTVPANQSGEYLSSILLADFFLPPDDLETYPLMDFEQGPIGLNDPSEGHDYQPWTIRYRPATDEFTYEAANTPATVVHTAPDVTEISGAFDQNGNPFLTYVQAGVAKYWWFDPNIGSMTVTNLPANSLTPRCCIDDKRTVSSAANISDIILCYVNGGALYKRMERDRYTIQYLLQDPFLHPKFELPAVLKRVGMNKSNRLQWVCDLANPLDWCGYKEEA